MQTFNPELFKTPTHEYRAKTFWAWNGRLDEKELIGQLHNFQQMGMGGAFFHSRTGLITEYLGREWFEAVNTCADESEKLKLEAWLYDEDRWPSGTAGGMVTKDPALRMHYLRLNISEGGDFSLSPGILAAFSVEELENLRFFGKKRLRQGEHAKGKVLYFTVEEMACHSNYNGYTYVDTMNPGATERFIETTHEKYAAACGDRMGTKILGVFTDEPHRGAVMCGFGMTGQRDPRWIVPYTDRLFEEFRSRFGYDLSDYLPELFLQEEGRKIHPVKWQYMELTQTLFDLNYMKPLQDWCHRHNIKLTGHVLHENTLTNQACMIGSVMRAYEYMDIPGIDSLGKVHPYWIAVQVRSVARQMGKKWVLSELYGCTGWELDFHSHKAIGDWQALFGVNVRCPHLSWYTMKGEGKRDYPASISHQSAWYEDYHYIEDYFARFHLMMSQGEPVCSTLVVYPVESVWAVIHPGWTDEHMNTLDESVRSVEEHFCRLFYALAGKRVDFDYGDEHFLDKYGKVEKSGEKALLCVGKMKYRAVVVPMMLTMRGSTLKLLEQFSDEGGDVIFTAGPPLCIDALPAGRPILPGARTASPNTVAGMLEAPFVRIKGNYPKLFAQTRRVDGGHIVVLLNTDAGKKYENVGVRFSEGGRIERWDFRTGKVEELPSGNFVTLDFPPSGEVCLWIHGQEGKRLTNKTDTLCAGEAARDFRYRLKEPNVCVLDMAEWTTGDKWHEKQDVLLADREIRGQMGLPIRGGDMLQPWYVEKQGMQHAVAGHVALRFSFNIESMPGQLRLAVESPEDFQISLNGCKDALRPTEDRWVDVCFTVLQVDIGKCRVGHNEIVFEADMRDNLNLEAVYLLGYFGVALNGVQATLRAMPETLRPGDISGQGFPFYSSSLVYFLTHVPAGTKRISLDGSGAALIKIHGNGKEKALMAPPFETDISDMVCSDGLEIEYVLTRRNTFGPLHFKPVRAEAYGPFSFVMDDKKLVSHVRYHLLPQGMLSPPVVSDR